MNISALREWLSDIAGVFTIKTFRVAGLIKYLRVKFHDLSPRERYGATCVLAKDATYTLRGNKAQLHLLPHNLPLYHGNWRLMRDSIFTDVAIIEGGGVPSNERYVSPVNTHEFCSIAELPMMLLKISVALEVLNSRVLQDATLSESVKNRIMYRYVHDYGNILIAISGCSSSGE